MGDEQGKRQKHKRGHASLRQGNESEKIRAAGNGFEYRERFLPVKKHSEKKCKKTPSARKEPDARLVPGKTNGSVPLPLAEMVCGLDNEKDQRERGREQEKQQKC